MVGLVDFYHYNSLFGFCLDLLFVKYLSFLICCQLKTPVPIKTLKLGNFEPGYRLDGRPLGNSSYKGFGPAHKGPKNVTRNTLSM